MVVDDLERQVALQFMNDFYEAGIWIQFTEGGKMKIGPSDLVNEHKALIQRARPHKGTIAAIMRETFAHGLFGDIDDDPRFETATCPECNMQVYVLQMPGDVRTLATHGARSGKRCRGGGRAAHVPMPDSLTLFLSDKAVSRPQGLLTWVSFWHAYRAWLLEHVLVPLPIDKDVVKEMDRRYRRQDVGENIAWVGLGLELGQWLGDQKKAEAEEKKRAQESAKAQVDTQLTFSA